MTKTKKAKKLLDDFIVPQHFDEDLFHLVGESRRPPYRWFLVGPERSGTTIHIDPLATSAWNTLIYGKKRWVLFPPYIPKRIVKGTDLIRKGEDDEAIHYFMYILPRIKQKAASQSSWKDSNNTCGSRNPYQNFRCYEFTQNAGETVFIPNGWWHAVLNLTHTIGITQNFCSHRNFDEVWKKSRGGRKKMAWKWLCRLDNDYPHLAHRARQLNDQDRFVMKYDPVEVQKRDLERKVAKAQKKEKKNSKKNYSSRHVKDGDNVCSYGSDSSEIQNKRRRIVSPSISP